MKNKKLTKSESEKISRSFTLIFTRSSMYKANHPFILKAIDEAYMAVHDGLKRFSSIVVMFYRDRFFVEEDPFDGRLNTSRMADHFKKVGMQSISFEKGVTKVEIIEFAKIFADSKTYKTADSMKTALIKQGVSKVRINHVIYRKVTADDVIISKKKLKDLTANSQDGSSPPMLDDVVNKMTENIIAEEVQKSVSLEALLTDPAKLSKNLIDKDLALAKSDQTKTKNPGSHIAEQLNQFKGEVQKASQNADSKSLSKLADAVFDLKKQLGNNIASQKELGISYDNEAQILDEADALTDQVLVQLLRDEYKKGAVSIPRMAQIIHRLIPESNELRRLVPKLREALLTVGMPKDDFFKLLRQLEKELQTENMAGYLQKGAKNIGVTSEELIKEFKNNPDDAAELIYLASEIRKGAGDEKVLTELLVEYVERIGSQIALDDVNSNGRKGSDDLKKIIAEVKSQIVKKLGKKGMSPDVLKAVQQKLNQRMESSFKELMAGGKDSPEASSPAQKTGGNSILKMLEECVDEGDELYNIIKQVRSTSQERGIDENDFQQLHAEIQRFRQLEDVSEAISDNGADGPLPDGILSQDLIHLFIKNEIVRSRRYSTPFSLITLSVAKVIAKQPIPKGSINRHLVNKIIMTELNGMIREEELVSLLTEKIILIFLPMTNYTKAKLSMSRLQKSLQAKIFQINKYSLSVILAGVVTSFDVERDHDLNALFRNAENEHDDYSTRLKNIQDLM